MWLNRVVQMSPFGMEIEMRLADVFIGMDVLTFFTITVDFLFPWLSVDFDRDELELLNTSSSAKMKKKIMLVMSKHR